ncbi:MAG: methionine--tRNA ligase, partial [Pseudomonadota bacterium]
RVLEASEVPDSTKLLKLLIDLGPTLGKRQVFSGIRPFFTPDTIVNTLVVVVANLQPRKMRFGTSEAMVLVAASADGTLHAVQPHQGAQPGDEVR